jgi:putative transcriptional regulator
MSLEIDNVENTLIEGGFIVSERCLKDKICFNLAARKGLQLLLVKCVENLLAIRKHAVSELKLISHHLIASPIIIAMNNSGGRMGDDAIYTRHGVSAITNKTLFDAITNNRFPIVEAKPGGFYVQLDGESIRTNRRMLNLSMGDLAKLVGVSRGTIYGYEKGLIKASVEIALKLETTLGIPLVQPINVFKNLQLDDKFHKISFNSKNDVVKKVASKLHSFGFTTNVTPHAPFDFIASSSENNRIIGTIDAIRCPNPKILFSIAEISDSKYLNISENDGNEDSTVSYDVFLKLSKKQELIALLNY